jgi:hypothetical protein
VAGRFTLTERAGPRVRRQRFDSLEPALAEIEERATALSAGARPAAIDLPTRRFDPAQQVTARFELTGRRGSGPRAFLRPALRAGVDVRGDGSIEPYLGKARREVLDRRGSESPFQALRRVLTETALEAGLR